MSPETPSPENKSPDLDVANTWQAEEQAGPEANETIHVAQDSKTDPPNEPSAEAARQELIAQYQQEEAEANDETQESIAEIDHDTQVHMAEAAKPGRSPRAHAKAALLQAGRRLAKKMVSSPETHENRFVYLEIGPGLTPSAFREANEFTGDRYYVGLDLGSDSSTTTAGQNYGKAARKNLVEMQQRAKDSKENISFVSGNGRHLPFPDGSVDQIYLSNVLTAPQTREQQLELLGEIKRVLKKEGEITIKCNWDRDLWGPEKVVDLLTDAELQIVEKIDSKEHNDPVQTFAYMKSRSTYGDRKLGLGGYFFRAQRPDAEVQKELWRDDPNLQWLAHGFSPSIGPYGDERQDPPGRS